MRAGFGWGWGVGGNAHYIAIVELFESVVETHRESFPIVFKSRMSYVKVSKQYELNKMSFSRDPKVPKK